MHPSYSLSFPVLASIYLSFLPRHIATAMRSLEVSSADISGILSNNPLVSFSLNPLHTPTPALCIQPRRGVPTNLQPRISVPSHNHSSFFSIDTDTRLFSPQTRGHISQAIQCGWADSTIRRYAGTIKQFIRFCDKERVPEHLRFPADEFVLCTFAASSLGKHSRSTPRARLSALKAWHIAHNVEWKGSSRLRYVVNGVHNRAPASSRQPPRPPVNANMIRQLVARLDPHVPLDAAVAACAVTAFWGQCRLGELLPSSASVLLSTPFPTRSDFKRSVRNPLSCILRLPRTKTHRHGQDVVIVDQQAPINPITLLKRHLHLSNVPNDAHIFSYTVGGVLTSLTKSNFLNRCNEIWQPLGYPHTAGHCFRIGGTTELLIAGTPPDVVKATGRWSSDSFLRYWRSLDDIAPQHLRNLHTFRRRNRRR